MTSRARRRAIAAPASVRGRSTRKRAGRRRSSARRRLVLAPLPVERAEHGAELGQGGEERDGFQAGVGPHRHPCAVADAELGAGPAPGGWPTRSISAKVRTPITEGSRGPVRGGTSPRPEDVPDDQWLDHGGLPSLSLAPAIRARSPLCRQIADLRLGEHCAGRDGGSRRIVKASITEQLAGRAVERTVAGRRAEYEAEMRRIVETTFSLIQRTGSLDPSMRDILAESGISTQAFYRYFASKDELMLVLLDEGRRRLMDTLERRMRRADTPADRLRAWIEGVLAQATNAGGGGPHAPVGPERTAPQHVVPRGAAVVGGSARRPAPRAHPRATTRIGSWFPRAGRCARHHGVPLDVRDPRSTPRGRHEADEGRGVRARVLLSPGRKATGLGRERGAVTDSRGDDRVLGDIGTNVVYEDDVVRVWRLKLAPGEESPDPPPRPRPPPDPGPR